MPPAASRPSGARSAVSGSGRLSGGASRSIQAIFTLVRASRPGTPEAPDFVNKWVNWGAGPRGVLTLVMAAKARAILYGRYHATAGDVQAVLAGDKVLFQGQEVAFVIAEDRYTAADAIELIEVEYEVHEKHSGPAHPLACHFL